MDIIAAIIAVLIPATAAYLALQAAKLSAKVDALPGIVKQIVAVGFAFLASKLGALLGVTFPADLSGLGDPMVVQGILAGLASFVLHRIFKPKA